MEWQDEAILLSARPHGETASIAMLFAREQGLHAGLLPGGQGTRSRGLLEPGNVVMASWKARLADHLGTYKLDLVASSSAKWLENAIALGTISSLCAVTEASVPERQTLPGLYAGMKTILSFEDAALLGPLYVKWEVELLRTLGYGLDLSCCALTGATTGLTHISPRTGRAVTEAAAAPYKERLLALPRFLCGDPDWCEADIYEGLALTGHFLSRHVFANRQQTVASTGAGALPFARQRLADLYRRQAMEKDQILPPKTAFFKAS